MGRTLTLSEARDMVRAEINIELICEPEHIPLEGNVMASGDDAIDKEAEDSVRRQLEAGNVWAWCSVTVRGTFTDLYEATDHLGGCSYESEEDFKAGGYYEDMVQTVIDSIASDVVEQVARNNQAERLRRDAQEVIREYEDPEGNGIDQDQAADLARAVIRYFETDEDKSLATDPH